MNSISGLGAPGAWQASGAGPQRPPRPDPAKVMGPTAELLGMSGDALRSALEGGTTLEQLASDQGVRRDDLLAALVRGLQDAAPADAPTGVDLTGLAEAIASGARPGGPPGGPGGPGGPGRRGPGGGGPALTWEGSRPVDLDG